MPDQQTGFVLIGGECAYWSRQPFMTLLRVNQAGGLRSGSGLGRAGDRKARPCPTTTTVRERW